MRPIRAAIVFIVSNANAHTHAATRDWYERDAFSSEKTQQQKIRRVNRISCAWISSLDHTIDEKNAIYIWDFFFFSSLFIFHLLLLLRLHLVVILLCVCLAWTDTQGVSWQTMIFVFPPGMVEMHLSVAFTSNFGSTMPRSQGDIASFSVHQKSQPNIFPFSYLCSNMDRMHHLHSINLCTSVATATPRYW